MAILIAAMCLSPYVVAEDIYYQTATMPNQITVDGINIFVDYERSEYWYNNVAPTAVSNSNFFVGHNFVGQNPTDKITFRTKHWDGSGDVNTFPNNTLWMGYNSDKSFSTWTAELGLKARKFVINDLRLGNSIINNAINETSGTVTLDGKMTVDGTVFFGINGVNKKIDVQSAIEGAGVITLAEGFNNDNLKISHANNAFKGTLNVSEGSSVLLNAQNAIINASSFIINSGATLKLQGHQSSLNNLSGSGTVSFTGNALTLNNIATEVPVLTGNTEFSGVISGSATLLTVNKTGDGMLTFSGSGMYSGETNVQEGTLRLAGNAIDSNWQIDVSSGATLEYFVDSGETETVTLSADNKITCDDGTVAKTGAGALTLTGAKTYTGLTTVSGGVLKLTGDAIVDNGPITVEANGTLEYNLSSGQTKKLTITDINKIVSTGKVIINGEDSTSQLCIEAQGGVDIQSMTISSGRVDIKGYMIGHITVDANGVFSPGNSVGEATFGGGFILKEGATLLIEQDATGIDKLNVGSFTFQESNISKNIELDITGIPFGSQYDIITSASVFTGNLLSDEYWLKHFKDDLPDYMTLAVVNNNTVRLYIDRNAVPEPSTWALLALGAAGLLYVRKRKN